MAEDGSVIIRINGDDSGLRQTLNNADNAVRQSASSAANAAQNMSSAATAAQNAASAMSGVNSQASAAASGLSNAGDAAEGAAGSAIDYSAALARMEQYLQQTVTALNTIQTELQETSEEEEQTGNRGSKAFGKITSAAKNAVSAIAKVAAAAAAAAAAAVAALAKSAIESYAEYEQLAGGVETLFKDSADIVKGYADEAYQTAGMSANAYMETVTSFSASLLQGLGGDTEKAAEIANQAIIDMSDNANKMGTDMTMIQNAYQGFAKQNYTMLDNLKLGYGGTQSEMARLINDSGVLGDTIEVTAETVNSVSFDKIIEAIHVIQTEMGISGISAEEAAEAVASGAMTEQEAFNAMGTTAKEAATTIQGSIFSFKAAWQNLMTGIADPSQDFDTLLENVINSFNTVVENLTPRIMAVLPQMAEGVTQLTAELLPMIPETISNMLPGVLEGANALIEALLDALSEIAVEAAPIVAENSETIIETLVDSLEASAYSLAESAAVIIMKLAEGLISNLDGIVQAAFDIITGLASGIAQALPDLIPAAVKAVTQIAETVIDNIDRVVEAAVQIIQGLITGLIKALPTLLAEAPTIITKLAGALIDVIPDVSDLISGAFVDGIVDGLTTFDWTECARETMTNLGDALEDAQKSMALVWDDIFTGGSVYGGDKSKVSTTEMVDNFRQGSEDIIECLEVIDGKTEESTKINEDWQKSIADGYAANAKAAAENGISWIPDLTNVDASEASAEAQEEVEGAVTKVSEEFKTFYENLKLEKAMGNIDNDEYIRRLSEKLNSSSEYVAAVYTKYWNEVTSANNKASKKAAEKVSDDFKAFYDNLKLLKNKGVKNGGISDEEYIDRLKKKLNSSKEYDAAIYSQYWGEVTAAEEKAEKEAQAAADKAAKEAQQKKEKEEKERKKAQEKADKERLEKQKKAAKAELSQLKSDLSALQSEYKTKYSEITKERDSLKSKLSENIFSTSETTETDARTGETTTTRTDKVADLKKKIDSRKKLGTLLTSLVKKGIPKGMLSELAGMDPEAALRFAAQLDGMSDNSWAELKSSYKEYEDINAKIADEVYAPQLAVLTEKYNADLEATLDGVTGAAAEKGAEMILAYAKGAELNSDEAFEEMTKYITETIAGLNDAISDGTLINGALTLALDNMDGTEAGKSIAQSVADGITDNASVITDAISAALTERADTITAAVEYKTSAVSSNIAAGVPISAAGGTESNVSAGSVQSVQVVPVNLLWKDGKVLAEIVNAENRKAAIKGGT